MYQALYRKYRPDRFETIVGQETTVKILTNSIKNNKLSHAYLFSGPRGTGKTSTAKILARTINCSNVNEDGSLCNECAHCLNSKDKDCVDIIEMDAASNNGVDEIREIKNKINLVPANLKYKVYIIDEVHMLSSGAFNALLKTLEEPPEHVVFILATTEIDKIPITILSRCQTIEFHLMSDNALLKQLKYICDCEAIEYEDAALEEIVICAEGSMRDGINILDKVRTFSDDNISLDDVRVICGKPNKETITEISDALIKKNIDLTLEIIRKAKHNGYDAVKILNDIILNIKNKDASKAKNELLTFLISLYDKIMNTSIDPFLLLEVELCGICTNYENEEKISTEVVQKNIEKSKVVELDETDLIDESTIFSNVNIRINNAFCGANKETLIDLKRQWKKFEEHTFDKKDGAYICELLDGEVVLASSSNIVITMPEKSMCVKANNDLEKYEELVEKYLGVKFKLCFISKDDWNIKKEEYILNKKKGIKYSYIEEDKNVTLKDVSSDDTKEDKITKKINDLFD